MWPKSQDRAKIQCRLQLTKNDQIAAHLAIWTIHNAKICQIMHHVQSRFKILSITIMLKLPITPSCKLLGLLHLRYGYYHNVDRKPVIKYMAYDQTWFCRSSVVLNTVEISYYLFILSSSPAPTYKKIVNQSEIARSSSRSFQVVFVSNIESVRLFQFKKYKFMKWRFLLLRVRSLPCCGNMYFYWCFYQAVKDIPVRESEQKWPCIVDCSYVFQAGLYFQACAFDPFKLLRCKWHSTLFYWKN